MRYAFVGLGNMASAIIRGMHASSAYAQAELYGYDRHPEKAADLPVTYCPSMEDLAENADLLLLCVKPYSLEDLLRRLRPLLKKNCIIASVAAGKPIAWYEERLPGFPMIRTMPNVNASVNAGVTAVCGGTLATPEQVESVRAIFDAIGATYLLEEKHFSVFSAIAGAAPAYTYLYMDALASAGVKAGLPKSTALAIAADMVLGSALLIKKTGEHPAALADKVCSPGGTTIEGLHKLRARGFENSVYEAIAAVIEKDQLISG